MQGCFKAIATIGVILGLIASIIGIYAFVTGNATLSSTFGNPQPTVTSPVLTPSPSAPQTPGFIATTPNNFQAWATWIILGLGAGFLVWGIEGIWSAIPALQIGTWGFLDSWDMESFVMIAFCGLLSSLGGGLLASIFFRGASLLSFIINIAIAFGVGILSSIAIIT